MSSLPFFLSALWQLMQLALKMGITSFSKVTCLSSARAVVESASTMSVRVASRM